MAQWWEKAQVNSPTLGDLGAFVCSSTHSEAAVDS